METFKKSISNGMEFYFRPRYDDNNKLYYLVEGYKNKIKPFRMIEKERDEDGNSWEISPDANIPDEIKILELDFNDAIICE